jgi:hypothetical protein
MSSQMNESRGSGALDATDARKHLYKTRTLPACCKGWLNSIYIDPPQHPPVYLLVPHLLLT